MVTPARYISIISDQYSFARAEYQRLRRTNYKVAAEKVSLVECQSSGSGDKGKDITETRSWWKHNQGAQAPEELGF